MVDITKSILVVGFNTRPLVYSLNKAGYDVFAIDFFGDLDLFPSVQESIIVMRELKRDYNSLKNNYSKHLAQFALKLYKKHHEIQFLLIGSGLDDAYEDRKLIIEEVKKFRTISVNNDLEVVKKSRDIESIYELMKSNGYKTSFYYSLENFNINEFGLKFPFILKKKRSAGGLNVVKIEKKKNFISQIQNLEEKNYPKSEWLIQEYIKGIPVSCTVISNGEECEIISINKQIIGEQFLNSPREFMYCGNIVPAGLLKKEEAIISELSLFLSKKLDLRGINGFDFVLKDHYPYLMECNPRIPGSIRASESVLSLNLLELHIESFMPKKWDNIKKIINSAKPKGFATKLIYFAPKNIDKNLLPEINKLRFIHDKSEPFNNILKGEPLCTILYKGKSLSESYLGALEIVSKINKIIG